MSTIFSQDLGSIKETTKNKPLATYSSLIKHRKRLNHTNSSKETYHIELDISHLNLSYKEGDAIAIYPENPQWLIDLILNKLELNGNRTVIDKKTNLSMSCKDYLLKKANLSRISSLLLSNFIKCSKEKALISPLESLFLAENAQKKADFINHHDFLSFIEEYPFCTIHEELLCSSLPPLLPRYYSIASSPKMHPDTLHLIVACFSYEFNSNVRSGIGSDYLCKFATVGETPINFYMHENLQFSLPQDPHIPIIMIGPGTGLAPFRGFIQNRVHEKIKTKNWLFFGERHQQYDFYYKEEFEKYLSQGLLQLNTAFSRDQEQKIYVQHRLLENHKTLWEWLQEGATIYVCGDAKHMCKDVEKAFLSIIQINTNLSLEDSVSFLKTLKKNKRYLLDVY